MHCMTVDGDRGDKHDLIIEYEFNEEEAEFICERLGLLEKLENGKDD